MRFVCNMASGAGAGAALAGRLAGQGIVHPIAEVREAAEAAAREDAVLVACGGDGTVSAVLAAAAGRARVGIIPLGTGNDAARAWGWLLSGWTLEARLAALRSAPELRHGRWRWSAPAGVEREFSCYASLGWDAAVAMRFHRWRQQHRRFYAAPWRNRLGYALAGLLTLPGRLPLHDGTADEPRAVRLFAAIPSYAGGTRLRGLDADAGRLTRLDLPGSAALLPSAAGWLGAPSARTAAEWTWELERAVAAQCDGEPWLAPEGRHAIGFAGWSRMLRGPGFRPVAPPDAARGA